MDCFDFAAFEELLENYIPMARASFVPDIPYLDPQEIFNSKPNVESPERSLCLGLIENALTDARHHCRARHPWEVAKKVELKMIAIEWLLSDSQELWTFAYAADSAGLTEAQKDFLRKFARNLLP